MLNSYSLTTPEFSVMVEECQVPVLGHLRPLRRVDVGIVGNASFVEQAGLAALLELQRRGFEAGVLIAPRPNVKVKQFSHGCMLRGQEIPR